MREHKYKAKRIDTGEWVFGDLISTENEAVIVPTNAFLCTEKDKEDALIVIGFIDVDPATVCEFTGSEGKYEGDILDDPDDEGGGMVIAWCKSRFAFVVAELDGTYIDNLSEVESLKVIGNIFDEAG